MLTLLQNLCVTMNTLSASETSLKRIRYAIFTFYFCQGLGFSSWASRIPDIKTTLGLDDAAWGTILLMGPIGQVCSMTISGLLVSRLGSKKTLIISTIGYILTLLPIGLATSEYAFIISLIVFGFFGNLCNISINTQGVNIETLYEKPIMSAFHGGWSLAGFTGSLIGLLMINLRLTPFQHFIFVIALVFIAILINHKYLLLDKKKPIPLDADYLQEREKKRKAKPEKFLFLLGLVAFCGMACEGAMFDWSGLYFKDIVKAPEKLVPVGFAAFMITMASGRFIGDKAIQRWGRRRMVQISGFLISLGLFSAVAFPHIVVTTISFMIIGLGVSSIVPIIYSTAGQKTKISTGMALTIVSSISFFGFLLGPPIIGYISHISNLRYSYALIGVFGICISILGSLLNVFKNK